ncbi:hypothetical protein HAHE_16370 [Haloferula helveola]|uniref:Autotransporter-associated beta strand repeat-containing protein n=1 Tax=Haloferula helveola TaxID=490095 RepID=A0ABM7R965_9BACT|nr:hypothetical protein HAHE_16370 [Haloferula helveola]
MKFNRSESFASDAHVTRLALLACAASCASLHAQLTWDPDLAGSPFGGAGVWDTTTANWWDGGANAVWDNSGATEGVFADAGGEVTLATGAGITVGDLTLNAGLGSAVVLKAETDNEGITVLDGSTWALNDNVLTFTNDQANDTTLSMAALSTLTVTGTGTFNTGVNPNGADWSVANANLVIDGPITVRGPANTIGQFGVVSMADGSAFRYERNTNQTFANNWILPSGNVTFSRQWNERFATYSGAISGSGGITVNTLGLGSSVFTGANSFTGKVVINGNMTINGDGALGAVPGAPVADQLSLDGGELAVNAGTVIPANRGVTIGAGGGTFRAGGGTIDVDSIITGAGNLELLGSSGIALNGVNTHTGTTTIDGITVNINDESALGTAPGSPVADSLTLRNGAVLFLGATSSLDSNRGITLDGGGSLIISNSPKSYGGTITGTGGFQIGRDDGFANVLTLNSDTSDYTDGTRIRKGRLALGIDEALPSDTVVTIGGNGGSNSKLYLEGHTQTIGGLDTSGSNTRQVVNFDTNAAPGSGGPAGNLIIDVADGESYVFGSNFGVNVNQDKGNFNVTKNGPGTQELSNIQIAGDVTVNDGILVFGGGPNAIANDITVNGGVLAIEGDADANSYTVGASGVLSIGDGNGNEGSIAGNTDITNDGIVLFNRGGSLAYGGVISGTGGVGVDGGVSVTLSGTNTFTGAVQVLDGEIILGSATALPDLSGVTVAAGEVFSVLFDGTTFASSDLPTVSSTVNFLDPTAYLGLDITPGSITLADAITGPHGLQMSGNDADVLSIGVAQTYTGNTRIFQGQMDLTASDQLPAGALMEIGGAGIAEFNLNGFNQTVAGLPDTLGSTRRINNRGAGPSVLTLDVPAGQEHIYTANILENGSTVSLVKNGAGEQAFEKNGFASYTGSATVNGGIMRFRFPTDIDPATQSITANAGGTFAIDTGWAQEWLTADIDTLLANATFNAGSFLGFQTDVNSADLTNDLAGSFGLRKLGDSDLTLSGTNTYTGATVLTEGALEIDSEDRLGTAPGSPAADHILFDGGSLRAIAPLVIDDANRGITVGTNGGSVIYGSVAVDLNVPIAGSGTLVIESGNVFVGDGVTLGGTNTFDGAFRMENGVLEVASASQLPANAEVQFGGSGILQIAGNIDGGAADLERNVGAGEGELNWTNGGGFAAVGADRTINIGGAGADLEWGVGGFFPSVDPQNFALFFGSPSATHTAILQNGIILPDAVQYSIRTIDGPTDVGGRVAGVISGAGGLNIRDNGTLSLSGTNTYAGPTNINNTSTLLIDGDQSAATGLITVTGGATLGGSGIAGGAVDVADGGTLAPGSSIGTLTTVDVVFADNSIFEVEIDSSVPSADKLVVTGGPVTINNNVTLDLSDIALSPQAISPGTKLTIIDYTGQSLGGTFAGLADGATVAVGSNSFEIDYDDGQTVTLTALLSNAYDSWVSANYPGLVGGFDDDDDNDGIPNGFEWYFFNSDPLTPDNSGSPLVEVTKTGPGTFTFVHRRPVDRTGLTESYEWSAALGVWTPSGGTESGVTVTMAPVTVVADGPGYELVTIEATVSPASEARIFARVELTNP